VCKIKEQNVGWDEFGTYDVKGLITALCLQRVFETAVRVS